MTNSYRREVKYGPAKALHKLARKQRVRSLPREEDVRGHLIRVPGTGVVVVPVEQLAGSWSCIVVAGLNRFPMIPVEDTVLFNGGRLITDGQLQATPARGKAAHSTEKKTVQGAVLRVDDLIVVPVCRADLGWDCIVVAGEKPLAESPYFVYVHEAVLAGAPQVLTEAEITGLPSPNPPRFVPRGCEDLLPLATEFTILPAGAVPGERDLDAYSIKLTWHGPELWDIGWLGKHWGPGGWGKDVPSRPRYPLDEAAHIARELVDDLEIEGLTWAALRSRRG